MKPEQLRCEINNSEREAYDTSKSFTKAWPTSEKADNSRIRAIPKVKEEQTTLYLLFAVERVAEQHIVRTEISKMTN